MLPFGWIFFLHVFNSVSYTYIFGFWWIILCLFLFELIFMGRVYFTFITFSVIISTLSYGKSFIFHELRQGSWIFIHLFMHSIAKPVAVLQIYLFSVWTKKNKFLGKKHICHTYYRLGQMLKASIYIPAGIVHHSWKCYN